MQRFSPYSAIVDALKESSTLDVLNTETRGEEQVRRKTALADNHSTDHKDVRANYEAASMKRSIYVKGFGEEDEKTQLKIEELFGVYGVTSVRLRRTVDGSFKGSAFIEFPSEDEQKQFLEQDDDAKPRWNDDEPLKIMSKEAYCRQKEDDINAGNTYPSPLLIQCQTQTHSHKPHHRQDPRQRPRSRRRRRPAPPPKQPRPRRQLPRPRTRSWTRVQLPRRRPRTQEQP
jgi:RNA recognition motif-containing protein